ncbi:hypothetical protein [Bacillus sp. FJAT-42315]|uniref:hypothetical protein n=1 Tax=Bacillus sp. FJAT-42315 TaxID=2014077 RepID=UPI000C250B02|nr:hypothetical protein [Bacillus sp. FJAT-42315]
MKFYKKVGHFIKCEFLDVDNLFNSNINKEINKAAMKQSKYSNKLINELFLSYYRPYMAIYQRIKNINGYEINDEIGAKDQAILFSINKKLGFKNVQQKMNVNYYVKNMSYLVLSVLNLIFIPIGLLLFVFCNSLFSKKTNMKNKVIFERTKAASSKFKWFKENLDASLVREKIRFNNEFYSSVKIKDFLRLLPFFIMNIIRDYQFISYYCKQHLGDSVRYYLFYYYSTRVPHSVLYEFILDCLLSSGNVTEFYSGNNLDRYGLIEEKICKKNNVKFINIPHGIEYGFSLPHMFVGDVFYAYSEVGAAYLNELYDTDKFLFSENVTRRIMSKNHKKLTRDVVFFTEASGIELNQKIISEIERIVLDKNIQFYVKLHPRDRRENYSNLNIKFIEDFDQAITNNICLARKSTVLLEAMYNDSKSLAILLNESDIFEFNQFPSLQDPKITKIYKFEELEHILKVVS